MDTIIVVSIDYIIALKIGDSIGILLVFVFNIVLTIALVFV